MGKPVRGRTAGVHRGTFAVNAHYLLSSLGGVAAVSSGPDQSVSKSQAGSGRSPRGSKRQPVPLRDGCQNEPCFHSRRHCQCLSGDRRQTADKHNVERAPSRPGANRSWIVRSGSAKNRSSWSRAYVLTVTRLTFSSRTLRRSRSLSSSKWTDISDNKPSWSLAEARRSGAKKGDSERVSAFRLRSLHLFGSVVSSF